MLTQAHSLEPDRDVGHTPTGKRLCAAQPMERCRSLARATSTPLLPLSVSCNRGTCCFAQLAAQNLNVLVCMFAHDAELPQHDTFLVLGSLRTKDDRYRKTPEACNRRALIRWRSKAGTHRGAP